MLTGKKKHTHILRINSKLPGPLFPPFFFVVVERAAFALSSNPLPSLPGLSPKAIYFWKAVP